MGRKDPAVNKRGENWSTYFKCVEMITKQSGNKVTPLNK